MPGTPLSFCSVHSTVTTMRAPFAFLAMLASFRAILCADSVESGAHLCSDPLDVKDTVASDSVCFTGWGFVVESSGVLV